MTVVAEVRPSPDERRIAGEKLGFIVEASRRTLAVRRQVLDLVDDSDLDDRFIGILVSLYRAERRFRRVRL